MPQSNEYFDNIIGHELNSIYFKNIPYEWLPFLYFKEEYNYCIDMIKGIIGKEGNRTQKEILKKIEEFKKKELNILQIRYGIGPQQIQEYYDDLNNLNNQKEIISFWTNVFFPKRETKGREVFFQTGKQAGKLKDIIDNHFTNKITKKDALWLILSSKNFSNKFGDYDIKKIDKKEFSKKLIEIINEKFQLSATSYSQAEVNNVSFTLKKLVEDFRLQERLTDFTRQVIRIRDRTCVLDVVNYDKKNIYREMNIFIDGNGYKFKLIYNLNAKGIISSTSNLNTKNNSRTLSVKSDKIITKFFENMKNEKFLQFTRKFIEDSIGQTLANDTRFFADAAAENIATNINTSYKRKELPYNIVVTTTLTVEIVDSNNNKIGDSINLAFGKSGLNRRSNKYNNAFREGSSSIEAEVRKIGKQGKNKKNKKNNNQIQKNGSNKTFILEEIFQCINGEPIQNVLIWLYKIVLDSDVKKTEVHEHIMKRIVEKYKDKNEINNEIIKNYVEEIENFIKKQVNYINYIEKSLLDILVLAIFNSINDLYLEIKNENEEVFLDLATKKVIVNKDFFKKALDQKMIYDEIKKVLNSAEAHHILAEFYYNYKNQNGMIGELIALKSFTVNNIVAKSQGQSSDIGKDPDTGKEYNFHESFRDANIVDSNNRDLGGINVKHYMNSGRSLGLYEDDGKNITDKGTLLKYLPNKLIQILNYLNVNTPYFGGNLRDNFFYDKNGLLVKALNCYLPQYFRLSGSSIMTDKKESNLFYQLNTVVIPSSIILTMLLEHSKKEQFFSIINPLEYPQELGGKNNLNLLSKITDVNSNTKLQFKGYTVKIPLGV